MRFILVYLFIHLLATSLSLHAAQLAEEGYFSGRIAKINKEINVIRIKVNFENIKYLNPKDQFEFWDEKNDSKKCKGYVLGRSSVYILAKVPDVINCEKLVYLTAGSFFRFYSPDLANNIKMGHEVISILVKKRMAINGQIDLKNREMSNYIERANVINARYEALKDKLEQEWQKELHAVEEDRLYTQRSYRDLERLRDEIDQKLELYKVKDENLTLDRWSLDSNLYFKK